MIVEHQPTVFADGLIVGLSSIEDGTMTVGSRQPNQSESDIRQNQTRYFQSLGIQPTQTTIVLIDYATDTFTRYRQARPHEKGDLRHPLPADALVVTEPGHALFLPLADCAGVVLFDPLQKVLMVSHLGRQSTEEYGAKKSVEYLQHHYAVQPANLLAWISPAVGSETYPLFKFDNRSLYEVNYEQLRTAGIPVHNIEIAKVDTAMHPEYYSHSQYLQGKTAKHGRHAIVAMMPMIAQGEPAS